MLSADRRGNALLLFRRRDELVAELAKHLTEHEQYDVELETEGPAALHRAKKDVPDLVVSEILVPVLDGLGLCRALKSDPATRRARVLLVSVLAAADRAEEAGADAFVRRPESATALVDAVHRLLRSAPCD